MITLPKTAEKTEKDLRITKYQKDRSRTQRRHEKKLIERGLKDLTLQEIEAIIGGD
jgi:hypothetical protein